MGLGEEKDALRNLCLVLGEILVILSILLYLDLTVGGLFPERQISDWEKISVALYLTVTLSSLILPIAGAKAASLAYLPILSIISSLLAAYSTLIIPVTLELSSLPGFVTALTGATLYLALFWLSKEELKMPKTKITALDVSAVSVFSAITALLTAGVGAIFPSPTGGYTHIGDLGIFLAALLYGPKIGGLVGGIGPLIADLLLGYPRWYVSILAHGIEGIVAGLGKGKETIFRIIYLAAAGLLMASTYFFVNVFIKGYAPAIISFIRDLFGQAGISLVLTIIIYESVRRVIQKG